jgi:hypothetical protein
MIAPGRGSPVTLSSSSSRLVRGNHAGDFEAAEAIRDLVETVTVFREPSRPGGVTVEISRVPERAARGAGIPQRGSQALWSEAGPTRGRYRLPGSTDTELAGRREGHRPTYSEKREDGTFSRGDFRYDPTNDVYHCPPGEGPDAMRVSSKSKNGSVA